MNRAERRRAAAHKRQRDLESMTRASRGIFSVSFFGPDGVRELLAAAEARDLQAVATLRAMDGWLEAAATQPPGDGPQCLTCRREMAGEVAVAFAVISPFAAAGYGASVGGICMCCAFTLPDIVAAAVAAWRETWPDLRLVEGGHA
jgi:hypothetical protein